MSEEVRRAAVIGVDPGYSGGVATLTTHSGVTYYTGCPMTERGTRRVIDLPMLSAFVGLAIDAARRDGTELVGAVVEDVWVQGRGKGEGEVRGGAIAAFALASTSHAWAAALTVLRVPVVHVAPQRWKRDLNLLMSGPRGPRKRQSRDAATVLFRSEHCRPPRLASAIDSVADAVLLAYWRLRKVLDGNED